ncbi:zinc-binding dehydrogenase [Bradyrhizobium sp. 156]|uniref:zinc-binding dehydrogenase n=1 Tax=Bradyrhizobium sp. 156 TaxID=2782630 RepID=UPI001FF8B67C|nr:zinc-binding dehydrogenase [Bradyrhizobium sp. 156]MCK1323581.1 zinc-binding dehydrogenase [Bradyrhizobium sp. 156]
MRAIVTDPHSTPRLAVRDAPMPVPALSQALVKVEAISLNVGETRTALAAGTCYIPGWDFAGVIEQPAADGSSPPRGARVFGFAVPLGAWAEYVTVRAGHMTTTPEGVTSVQAASLPVAGLTALVCLERAGPVLGRRVLVTGAAGGVGRFACKFAALSGGKVFAISRRPSLPDQLRADGVDVAGVFTTMAEAKSAGQYDVILDSVGGETLALALTAVAVDGVVVNCGNSEEQLTSFNAREFFHKANARFEGVWGARELANDCSPLLARVADLVVRGKLNTPIDAVLPWTQIAEAAERLVSGGVDGKVVLTVD